ncbi:MAG: alpha/beta hydrolase [Patescibacteria group bacterium]
MTEILILHGWGSSSAKWEEVKGILVRYGIKVFVPDLPGFGYSQAPSRAWAVDDYVEWVREFCEKNNLSQFFLLGHSFGGTVAVKFSLKYPEKIKKLFLVAPAIIRRKSFQKETIKKTASFFSFLPSFIKKIIYKLLIRSDYPATFGVMRETYLKIIQENLSSYLSEIKVPTIIIWGERDIITPFSDAHFIKEKIPGSKLKTFPDVGHSLHKEAPAQLVQNILQDLQ